MSSTTARSISYLAGGLAAQATSTIAISASTITAHASPTRSLGFMRSPLQRAHHVADEPEEHGPGGQDADHLALPVVHRVPQGVHLDADWTDEHIDRFTGRKLCGLLGQLLADLVHAHEPLAHLRLGLVHGPLECRQLGLDPAVLLGEQAVHVGAAVTVKWHPC